MIKKVLKPKNKGYLFVNSWMSKFSSKSITNVVAMVPCGVSGRSSRAMAVTRH